MARPNTSAHAVVVAFPGSEHSLPKPKRRYTRLTTDARDRLADDITALGEHPGKADYNALAHRYGCSLRTVQDVAAKVRDDSYTRNADTGRVLTHALPANSLEVIRSCGGNSHEAWVLLHGTGHYGGTYSTFRRRLNDKFGANVMRGIRSGPAGMDLRAYQSQQRNAFLQTYTIDLFWLRAPVRDGARLTRPVGALVVEDNTGTVVNAHLFPDKHITSEMVCSLLGVAFAGKTIAYPVDPGTGEAISADSPAVISGQADVAALTVGGLVSFVRCDNEALFVSREVDEKLVGFGVRVLTGNAYSPHEDGRHERKHRTSRDQALRMLPQTADGPRDITDELLDDREPVTLSQARDLLDQWVTRHNSTVDSRGSSPVMRWLAALNDGIAPRYPDRKSLAPLALLHPATCQRYGLGVLLAKEHYQHPKLTTRGPKRYFVGLWLGDPDHVELWVAQSAGTAVGAWVGTATRQGALTAAESGALTAHNASERATVVAAIARSKEVSAKLIDALAPPRPAAGAEQMADQLADDLADLLTGAGTDTGEHGDSDTGTSAPPRTGGGGGDNDGDTDHVGAGAEAPAMAAPTAGEITDDADRQPPTARAKAPRAPRKAKPKAKPAPAPVGIDDLFAGLAPVTGAPTAADNSKDNNRP